MCSPYSWVDVDTTGTVAAITGYPTTNRAWYRVPAAPSAIDVARMASDVSNTYRKSTFVRDAHFENRAQLIWDPIAHRPSTASERPFNATMLGIFTWFAVGRYQKKNDLLNTFQAVIASNACMFERCELLPSSMHCMFGSCAADNRSFVTFCYDNIVYDAGTASVGTHVNAGFNSGTGNSYSLPGANTAADLNFACGGSNGCYTFRCVIVVGSYA